MPSTMSLAVWSMTRRQQRMPMFALMPVGRLAASGRCVARSRMMPSAGPRLTMAVASRPNSLPCSGWLYASWHSSRIRTSGCRPRLLRAASCGVTLFSGHRSFGRSRITFARRSSFR
ncbi:MAG TPA: hypothetical protein DHU96_19625 [Actinobacteria bacterium]|nr:hypothetical protein [Actinomycetota bacterium]